MATPDFNCESGTYELYWEENSVKIIVDRIQETSRGDVSSFIEVTTTKPGYSPHLNYSKFTLTTTGQRKSLAQHLQNIMALNDETWITYIEQMCVMVLKHYHQGDDPIELDRYESESDDVISLLHPVLVNGPNVIYGRGGIGKSLIALYFSLLLNLNKEHNDFTPINYEMKPVLYLDWEGRLPAAKKRETMILRGLGLTNQSHNVVYIRMKQTLHSQINQVKRHIRRYHAGFLVIDSAAPASGSPSDEKETMRFFNALENIGDIPSLIIAHVSKNANESSIYGSVFNHNLARNVYELASQNEPGSRELYLGLIHKKSNDGRILEPTALKFEFDTSDEGDLLTISKSQTDFIPEADKAKSLRQRLIDVIQNNPMTLTEIIGSLDMTKNDAAKLRATLNRYKDDFTKTQDDKWRMLNETERLHQTSFVGEQR